jgi:hypothetical protein
MLRHPIQIAGAIAALVVATSVCRSARADELRLTMCGGGSGI